MSKCTKMLQFGIVSIEQMKSPDILQFYLKKRELLFEKYDKAHILAKIFNFATFSNKKHKLKTSLQ